MLELAGPCGADPWYIEVGADDDPVEVVARLSRNLMGEPLLVHSTSWRRARGSVISELARSDATRAPVTIAYQQVLEHGLRHLAWLDQDDDAVRSALSDEWKALLTGYVSEPFRHLG